MSHPDGPKLRGLAPGCTIWHLQRVSTQIPKIGGIPTCKFAIDKLYRLACIRPSVEADHKAPWIGPWLGRMILNVMNLDSTFFVYLTGYSFFEGLAWFDETR